MTDRVSSNQALLEHRRGPWLDNIIIVALCVRVCVCMFTLLVLWWVRKCVGGSECVCVLLCGLSVSSCVCVCGGAAVIALTLTWFDVRHAAHIRWVICAVTNVSTSVFVCVCVCVCEVSHPSMSVCVRVWSHPGFTDVPKCLPCTALRNQKLLFCFTPSSTWFFSRRFHR